MDTKINLTIYDLLSHLFPGAAFLLTLNYFNNIGKDLTETQMIIFLVVFSYLIGLVLHSMGNLLFKSFYLENYRKGSIGYKLVAVIEYIISKTPLPLKVKRTEIPIKEKLIQIFKNKFGLNLEGKRLALFSVADTFVSSLSHQERDILLAKEGLFRSLTSLGIIEIIYLSLFVYPNNKLLILVIGLFFIELFRYSREHYRIIKNQQIKGRYLV